MNKVDVNPELLRWAIERAGFELDELAHRISQLPAWERREKQMNARLQEVGVPVQVAGMSSVWTVLYTQPARFNWLLQHYLRLEGVALSWVGTARIIWSLNFSDAEFEQVLQCFARAAQAMQADGWWWSDGVTTNKDIKRSLLREMLAAKLKS